MKYYLVWLREREHLFSTTTPTLFKSNLKDKALWEKVKEAAFYQWYTNPYYVKQDWIDDKSFTTRDGQVLVSLDLPVEITKNDFDVMGQFLVIFIDKKTKAQNVQPTTSIH